MIGRRKAVYKDLTNSERIIHYKFGQNSYSNMLREKIRQDRRRKIIGGAVVASVAVISIAGFMYSRQIKAATENIPAIAAGQMKTDVKQDGRQLGDVLGLSDTSEGKADRHIFSFTGFRKLATEQKNSEEDKEVVIGSEETAVFVEKAPKVDRDYFSDALFIGDSRTEGLIMNNGLSKATFYGGKGLMVNTILTEKIVGRSGSKKKITLAKALKKNDFNKIYIMFGVNELGWTYEHAFEERYSVLIQQIKKYQPDAIIYVQSILPVSSEKEKKDKIYNNKKIRRYNKMIKNMVKEQEVHYLDVASEIETKSGVLPKSASTDGVHLNKAYCEKWLDYLMSHTVPAEDG